MRDKDDLEVNRSFWRSKLLEFGEDVLAVRRKSLNLNQADISNLTGLSQSEVSRIESGFSKPRDLPTTELICKAYRLTNPERDSYMRLTAGVGAQNTKETEEIINNLLDGQIPFISHTNRAGSPSIAIEQAEIIMRWVEGQDVELTRFCGATVKKLSYLLLEECAAWWDITSPRLIDDCTKPLMKKMCVLSNGHPASKLYLNINRAFHSYIKDDYQSAYRVFKEIILDNGLKGDPWEVEVMRAYAIVLGKLGRCNELKCHEDKLQAKLSDDNLSDLDAGYLLEGLGRAHLESNVPQGYKILHRALECVKFASGQPGFLKVRFVQAVRSNLIGMNRAGVSKDSMLEYARPALLEAEKGGLIRHKNQMLQSINSKNP